MPNSFKFLPIAKLGLPQRTSIIREINSIETAIVSLVFIDYEFFLKIEWFGVILTCNIDFRLKLNLGLHSTRPYYLTQLLESQR